MGTLMMKVMASSEMTMSPFSMSLRRTQGQGEGAVGHSYIPVNCLHPHLIPVTELVSGPSGTSGKDKLSSSDSGHGNSSVEDILVCVLNYQNIPG